MNRMLLRKAIREALPLWIASAVALFAFAWVRVWVTGLFEFTEVREILDRFRRFERFSPIPFDQLATYEGRVGMSFDEPLVLLCIVIWGIARGSDVVSGELSRGTMEMLLSQPISRAQLLKTHLFVATVGLLGLVAVHWGGIWCGIQTVSVKEASPAMQIEIPWIGPLNVPGTQGDVVDVPLTARVHAAIYLPATLNLWTFGFLVLGLATMISCFESFRWRTIGIAVAIHVFQVVLFGLSRASERLNWLQWGTYCSCYRPQELTRLTVRSSMDTWHSAWMNIEGLGPIAGTMLMAALGALMIGIGQWQFNRRDLDPPI